MVNEFIASSRCVLCLLIYWEKSLSTKREEAAKIIDDIFAKLLNLAGEPVDYVSVAPPHNIRHLCPMVSAGRACIHCHDLEASLASTGLRWPMMHSFVSELWRLYDQFRCGYAGLWFKTVIDSLAEFIDDRILPLPWQTEPMNIVAPRGAKRRRRQDIEVLKLVSNKRRKLLSTNMVVRSGLVDARTTLAAEAEHVVMGDYMVQLMETFGSKVQLSIALDASRLGGENTEFYAIYNHEVDKCGWLPPQALVVRLPTRGNWLGTPRDDSDEIASGHVSVTFW